MDFLNSMKGQEGSAQTQPMEPNKQGGDTGMMGKLNGMMGGGAQSENKEDMLDKGVDWVQERMGGGSQTNENAMEQMKDEQISDAIRRGFKSTTGRDIPIQDK